MAQDIDLDDYEKEIEKALEQGDHTQVNNFEEEKRIAKETASKYVNNPN